MLRLLASSPVCTAFTSSVVTLTSSSNVSSVIPLSVTFAVELALLLAIEVVDAISKSTWMPPELSSLLFLLLSAITFTMRIREGSIPNKPARLLIRFSSKNSVSVTGASVRETCITGATTMVRGVEPLTVTYRVLRGLS